MTLYVKYSKEPPGLPIAVAESAGELAEMTGMTKESIYSLISKKRPYIAKIEIQEEREDERAEGQ